MSEDFQRILRIELMSEFDFRLAMICGSDIPIPSCQLIAHQPRLEEIALIGEKNFFSGVQTLCLHKTMFIEDKNLLLTTTNFQIFMMIMSEKQAQEKKDAVIQVFTLLFPDYKILFTPKSLIFQYKDSDEQILVDVDNFESFQEALRNIFCMQDGPMDQQAFNPVNNKAKQIADKIMAGRKRVSELKGNSNTSVFTQYISMLTIGLHISLLELKQLTMFQLYDLVERFMLWINWDIDLRSRLAGAKPEEHPENWMKNIH